MATSHGRVTVSQFHQAGSINDSPYAYIFIYLNNSPNVIISRLKTESTDRQTFRALQSNILGSSQTYHSDISLNRSLQGS